MHRKKTKIKKYLVKYFLVQAVIQKDSNSCNQSLTQSNVPHIKKTNLDTFHIKNKDIFKVPP